MRTDVELLWPCAHCTHQRLNHLKGYHNYGCLNTGCPCKQYEPREVTSVDAPSIGRIVHYVSYGTSGGEYASECRAAIVTNVDSDTMVGLFVANPDGTFHNHGVQYSEEHKGGSWHWPERV